MPPPPRPLVLPAPEQLGVAGVPSTSVARIDWENVHRRLDNLGALAFHQQKLEAGGCRIMVLLPTEHQEHTHQVEADASTASEAISLVLDRAEKCVRSR
jgi:hypothetical protein